MVVRVGIRARRGASYGERQPEAVDTVAGHEQPPAAAVIDLTPQHRTDPPGGWCRCRTRHLLSRLVLERAGDRAGVDDRRIGRHPGHERADDIGHDEPG